MKVFVSIGGAVTAEASRAPDGETIEKISIVAGLWWAGTGVVAAGLGGWFAERAMGSADRDDGCIHGLLSWAAPTLIVAFFLTHQAKALRPARKLELVDDVRAIWKVSIRHARKQSAPPKTSNASSNFPPHEPQGS